MTRSELQFAEPLPFYKNYIDLSGDAELSDMLQKQLANFPEFIESIPDNKWNYAYAPEKWSIAEVLVHIIDSERIFQYRALRFSRNDATILPGFDQDAYVGPSKAERRSKESVLEEYRAVRKSTLSLFANFDRSDLEKTGTASNLSWSVGALGFVICGHQKHHRNIIRERYL